MVETVKKPKKSKPKQKPINVKPLRTQQEIEDFKWALRFTGKARDLLMFNIGINTGLRVSDIVPLKVGELRGKNKTKVYERKTKKYRELVFSPQLQADIEDYARGMSDDDYLFPSQKGDSYITETQAYRILQKAADVLEREDIGTHTMRKTFGYMYYRRTKDVAQLQKILNHSHPSITLEYIGVTDTEIEEVMSDFYL